MNSQCVLSLSHWHISDGVCDVYVFHYLTKQTAWSRVLPESPTVPRAVKIDPHFMEREVSNAFRSARYLSLSWARSIHSTPPHPTSRRPSWMYHRKVWHTGSNISNRTCWRAWLRWHFMHPSGPVLWATQPPIQRVPSLYRGIKRPGRGFDHPPPSCAEVEGREELHICSPSAPSSLVLGWILHLPLPLLWRWNHEA